VKVDTSNIETSFASFKRLRVCLLAVACLAWSDAQAGFDRLALPAQVWGRGLAACAVSGAESALFNPSALASVSRGRVTVFYSPSPFGLPELSNGGIAIALPVSLGTLQAAATRTGSTLYSEQCALLSFACALDDAFSIGTTVSYNAVSVERYGSAHAFGLDIGVAATPLPFLTLAASMLNANRPTIGAERDELPRVFLLGFACRLSDRAVIAADLAKDIRYPESVRVGIEVAPVEYVALCTGISTAPARFHAGAGLRLAGVGFDYSITTHQELGPTHALGLSLDL